VKKTAPSSEDAPIDDDDLVYRRIGPDKVVYSEKGGSRPGSHAFENKVPHKLSGQLASIVDAQGLTPERYVKGMKGHGIVSLRVGYLRGKGQEVRLSPELGDPAHVDVVGEKPRSLRREFATEAEWVVLPEPRDTGVGGPV
jgi:hypothetical protein